MTTRRRLPGTPEPMRTWPGANGLRMAGDHWGDPAGRAVLLLHGGGQTRHAWKGTGEILGRAGYFAVALDARGHGDSDWAGDGDYHIDRMIDDIVAVAAAVGDPRPVLVGASMGGSTALIAVGEGRIDVSALVLVDTAPQLEEAGTQRIMDFMHQRPDGFDSLEQVAEAIGSYQPHRQRPQSLDGLAKNIRLDEHGRYRWHWDPRWLQRGRFAEERRNRMQAAAERLAGPVQLVRGGLSDVLSEAGAQAFLATCRHAEYVNVTDAAHMVAGDRNDIFSGAVTAFLARTVPARK